MQTAWPNPPPSTESAGNGGRIDVEGVSTLHQKLIAIFAFLLLLALPLRTYAVEEREEALQDVAKDLPILSPDLIWEQQLPGRPRYDQRQPNANVAKELNAAIDGLSAGWSPSGNKTDWTGATTGLLTHLSSPGEPPRAIFWLTDGNLYLVEERPTGWKTSRLTEIYTDYTAVIDLSGDGQPEVIGATHLGSGAFLYLQILAWDKERVWTAFTHKGRAMEPGLFGWFDAEGDGRRELWIDTGTTRGLFTAECHVHSPFLRDRLIFRWVDGTYKQTAQYRYATPTYHLNRYLYLANKGDWQATVKHVDPGAQIDRKLVAELGLGPFSGGSDVPFVNGRLYFTKGTQGYYADFGQTGRLIRLGASPSKSDLPLCHNRPDVRPEGKAKPGESSS